MTFTSYPEAVASENLSMIWQVHKQRSIFQNDWDGPRLSHNIWTFWGKDPDIEHFDIIPCHVADKVIYKRNIMQERIIMTTWWDFINHDSSTRTTLFDLFD